LVGAPIRGGTPPQRLTMGPVQKNQSTSALEVLFQRLTDLVDCNVLKSSHDVNKILVSIGRFH